MRFHIALGLVAALLLSAQPAAALNAPTPRSKSVCLAELKAANKAKRAPQLKNCNLTGANLRRANLRGADLRNAVLHNANLTRANLRGAKLADVALGGDNSGTLLVRADLRDIDWSDVGVNPNTVLSHANLTGVDWSGKDLSGVTLDYANLSGANLTSAQFFRADLRHANLGDAVLYDTNFREALLDYANLTGSTDLYCGSVQQQPTLAGAIMPDGTTYGGSCP